MLSLPLAAITKKDLDALVTSQTQEGRSLEYKRDLNLNTDGEKREFAKDVSSFANAAGGFLVFGVVAKKDEGGNRSLGYPEKLVGVKCPNWDAMTQQIENVIRDRLDPRVQGFEIHKVDGFDLGPIVLVHVPKSWAGPHMLSFGQTHFYSRNSSGVHPLDVREIGHAFRIGTERAETLRRFRDGRLGSIIAGEAPVPLFADDSKLVIHVCPLEPYAAAEAPRFGTPGRMPPSLAGSGWNCRHNIDGFLTYPGTDDGPKRSYSLAFRTGSFEATSIVDRHREKGWTLGLRLEKAITDRVGLFVSLSREHGYDGPLSVMATLLGVYGTRLILDERSEAFSDAHDRIDRSTVILPDVLLDGAEPDFDTMLRPLFDALWQSSGWPRSPCYDASTGKRLAQP